MCKHSSKSSTSRALASWVTEVAKGEKPKEKREPVGMKPDHLAVTAVDGVISWNSFSSTFLSPDSRHHCLMMQLSLDPFCLRGFWIFTGLPVACSFFWTFLILQLSLAPVCFWHRWILTALPVDSFGDGALAHSSLLTNFFLYSRHFSILLTPYFLHFPTLFTSLLCFSLLSSLLYSFHSSFPIASSLQ